jgi:hypothetical protein
MSLRPFRMLAASVVAMLGCRDGLSPASVRGTYVLEKVGDDPMPSVIFRGPQGTVRVIADTLRLVADGRGTFVRVHVIESAESDAVAGAPGRLESALSYRVDGSKVEISYVCPPNAMCTPGPHLVGWRQGDRMLIDDVLIPEDLRYYRRVASSPLWSPR